MRPVANPGRASIMNADTTFVTPRDAMTLFLCGDVMPGRGIDQILPYPCDPRLHERYMGSAVDYVRLAEEATGPICRPVGMSYIWGAALEEMNRARPDARIINLETSVTRSDAWAGKGINYRMSPENAECLRAAGIDCCVLANNHVLDWGEAGLLETLVTIDALGIKAAGAGRDLPAASRPAVLEIAGKGRVIVHAFGHPTSGVPAAGRQSRRRPGSTCYPIFPTRASRSFAGKWEDITAAGRCGRCFAALGRELGIRNPAAPDPLRASIDRGSGRLRRVWSFVASCESNRNLSRPIDFIRLRRLLERLRRDCRARRIRGDLALMYFASVHAQTGALARLDMMPLQNSAFAAKWCCARGRDLAQTNARTGKPGIRHAHRYETRRTAQSIAACFRLAEETILRAGGVLTEKVALEPAGRVLDDRF